MKNSRLFDRSDTSTTHDKVMDLINGQRVQGKGTPMKVAWTIEAETLARGWPDGDILGHEEAIRARLGIGRESIREAIKIVESRGALEMKRGRQGGLMVCKPKIENLAQVFAHYLILAGDHSPSEITVGRNLDGLIIRRAIESDRKLPALHAGESVRNWLARSLGDIPLHLYALVVDHWASAAPADQPSVFDASEPDAKPIERAVRRAIVDKDESSLAELMKLRITSAPEAQSDTSEPFANRANSIVSAIMKRADDGDRWLGSEAKLCDDFDASRTAVRQALRVLTDLDLLEVKRGRNGGYTIKEPSSVGVIRRAFSYFAAEHLDANDLGVFLWDLNAVSLELAIRKLSQFSDEHRNNACDWLERLVAPEDYADRFILLLSAIAEIASSPLTDTLARCVFSFQVRRGDLEAFETADWPQEDLKAMEQELLNAMRSLDFPLAKLMLSTIQTKIGTVVGLQAS